MRRTTALILTLIGILFIKAALWLDAETLRGVTSEVIEKLTKPPVRDWGDRFEDVERYTVKDFEEPH